MTHTYRMAGRAVAVASLHPAVHALCADYRCDDAPPDFQVVTDAAAIARERAAAGATGATEGGDWSDAYLETLAVYRAIAERMPGYDTILFHGSAVAVDGAGYVFTAPSGTGKSTHARLWREYLGARAVMVNDDKPLLRLDGPEPLVCGTPWDGKHRLSRNMTAPLRALAVLERSAVNRATPLTAREAYPLLLRQTYRPADPAMLARTLRLLDKLAGGARLWRLECNMTPDAARVAYERMRG